MVHPMIDTCSGATRVIFIAGLATMTGLGMFEAVRDCLVAFHLEGR